MKLEIGSGKHSRRGYEHLDIDRNAPHVEYIGPAWNVPTKDNIFEEIYARHFLEHLSPEEADDTIIEWRRVLRVDGIIHVIVPNLEFHAKQLLMKGNSKFVNGSNFRHAMAAFFGWQGRGDNHYHYWGYTPKSLVELFDKHGFKNTKLIKCRECDIEIKVQK